MWGWKWPTLNDSFFWLQTLWSIENYTILPVQEKTTSLKGTSANSSDHRWDLEQHVEKEVIAYIGGYALCILFRNSVDWCTVCVVAINYDSHLKQLCDFITNRYFKLRMHHWCLHKKAEERRQFHYSNSVNCNTCIQFCYLQTSIFFSSDKLTLSSW